MKDGISNRKFPVILFPKELMNVKGGSSKYYADIQQVIEDFCGLHGNDCKDLIVIFDRLPLSYPSVIKYLDSPSVLYIMGSEPLRPYVRDYLRSNLWVKSFFILPFYMMRHSKHCSQLTISSSLQMADYIVVPSKVALRYLKVPARTKIYILPPGIRVPPEVPSIIQHRKDIIAMVGRISPEKNYETAIRILGGLKTSSVRLVIMGFLSHSNYDYYLYLRYLAKKLGVQEQLIILTDVSDAVKKKMLNRAKIILHNRIDGLFEIGVAEGMSYGCVPIVRYGGTAWWEILQCGRYGFSYKTVNEAVGLIETLLSDYKSMKKYSTLAYERARQLSFSIFRERLYEILEEVTTFEKSSKLLMQR